MLNNHSDPVLIVGHIASALAIMASWVGLLAPAAAFFASCMAFAWYCALFYDRNQSHKAKNDDSKDS